MEELVEDLTHVLILWLPAKITSRFQPMDQGIIRTWKACCRRMMLRHVIKEVEGNTDPDLDPYRAISLLQAVR